MQKKAGAGVPKPRQSKKVKTDKSKAEYFFYKKLGHQKQNCLAHIATLDPNRPKKKKRQMLVAQGNYMITPCNFSIYDSTNQILDIESLINIYNSLQGLQVRRRFKNNERFLTIGDGRSIPVQALGVIEFFLGIELLC